MSEERPKLWYLFDGSKVSGPFDKTEIDEKVEKGLHLDTQIWNHGRAAWEFLAQWVKAERVIPPWPDTWYVHSNGLHSGPFNLETLITKLNQKELGVNPLIWRAGQRKWMGVHDFPEVTRAAGLPLRKHVRVPLIGLTEIMGLEQVHSVPTVNLSEGGLALKDLPQVSLQTLLRVKVVSDDFPKPIEAQAKVVYQRSELSGVEFQGLSRETAEIVRGYINARMTTVEK